MVVAASQIFLQILIFVNAMHASKWHIEKVLPKGKDESIQSAKSRLCIFNFWF